MVKKKTHRPSSACLSYDLLLVAFDEYGFVNLDCICSLADSTRPKGPYRPTIDMFYEWCMTKEGWSAIRWLETEHWGHVLHHTRLTNDTGIHCCQYFFLEFVDDVRPPARSQIREVLYAHQETYTQRSPSPWCKTIIANNKRNLDTPRPPIVLMLDEKGIRRGKHEFLTVKQPKRYDAQLEYLCNMIDCFKEYDETYRHTYQDIIRSVAHTLTPTDQDLLIKRYDEYVKD